MSRTLFVAVLLALVTGVANAQETYMPVAEGNVWTYEVKKATTTAGFEVTATSSVTATCKAGKALGGLEYHRIAWSDRAGELDHDVWIRVDGDGVRIGATSSRKHLLLLPGDLGGGQTHVEIEAGGTKITLDELKVGKATEVTVPAGTYTAVPVSNLVKVAAVTIETTVWYARGVGAVRILERVNTGGVAEVKRELKLKSFTQAGGAEAQPEAKPEQPEAKPEQPEAKPEQPAKPKKQAALKGQVPGLVQQLTAKGPGDGRMKELNTLLSEACKRGGEPGAAALLAAFAFTELQHERRALSLGGEVEERRLVVDGLTTSGIQDALVVCRGDLVSTGTVKDSVLVVVGDIKVTGYLKDCLVLCVGDVSASAYIKDNLLVATGKVKAGGYVKENTIQAAGGVSAGGYSKGNAYLNGTKVTSGLSKGDEHHTVSKSPLDLLR